MPETKLLLVEKKNMIEILKSVLILLFICSPLSAEILKIKLIKEVTSEKRELPRVSDGFANTAFTTTLTLKASSSFDKPLGSVFVWGFIFIYARNQTVFEIREISKNYTDYCSENYKEFELVHKSFGKGAMNSDGLYLFASNSLSEIYSLKERYESYKYSDNPFLKNSYKIFNILRDPLYKKMDSIFPNGCNISEDMFRNELFVRSFYGI